MTAPTTSSISIQLHNPERVAWGVLLIAFAVFCLTCMLSVVAVHFFFFQSTVPMLVTVSAARGVVGLTPLDLREIPVHDSSDLSIGNIVRPGIQAQALMVFRDPYHQEDGNDILAMLTLDDAISAATLRSAERPRFDWSNSTFEVDLDGVQGDIDVLINDGFESNFVIFLQTTQGAQISIAGSGQYHIHVLEDDVRVVNQLGEVVLIDPRLPLQRRARGVPAGYQGIVQAEGADIAVNPYGLTELLQNSDFKASAGSLPVDWRCGNIKLNTPPSGAINIGTENGRHALFMIRGEGANTPGGTMCEQGAKAEDSPQWLDVSQYNYLALQTTFYVNYQSLNRCGVKGSECPLIVLIQYIDRNGSQRELLYGFYSVNNPGDEPFTCEGCGPEHVLVHEKTWYTFNTGNILSTLLEDQYPHYITLVRFYASGHQYDTRISEISLMGGVVPPSTPATASDGN
ncbi:MAG TPA: hypothetical protein VHL11_10220 [Phototrophicaceae bacterium]|nr:hypothetical protein [Phototrophicaceae bacterium]